MLVLGGRFLSLWQTTPLLQHDWPLTCHVTQTSLFISLIRQPVNIRSHKYTQGQIWHLNTSECTHCYHFCFCFQKGRQEWVSWRCRAKRAYTVPWSSHRLRSDPSLIFLQNIWSPLVLQQQIFFQLTVSCGSCNTLVKVSGPSCPDIIFTFQSKSYIFGVRYNEMWINPTYRNTPHHIFYLTHPPVTALTPAVE